MAKYLWQASYTPEGAQGLQKDGGTARRAAVHAKTATAVSLAVNAVGAAHLRTVVLVTPEDMDAVVKKSVDYRPPGAK